MRVFIVICPVCKRAEKYETINEDDLDSYEENTTYQSCPDCEGTDVEKAMKAMFGDGKGVNIWKTFKLASLKEQSENG